jgi:hypothetical protein
MVLVSFGRDHLPVETATQVCGMDLHIITDLIRDDRTAVFGDKYDVVSQQVYGMGFLFITGGSVFINHDKSS